MPSELATAVQRFYPQIYLACHSDHLRARSNEFRLSGQDSALLAHLDEREPILAGELARHLGVAPSSLSAAIKRLERLGYLSRAAGTVDRRQIELRLTSRGLAAMAATSVLDHTRLEGVLHQLSAAERRRAVAGLALLAKAARRFQFNQPQRRS